MPCSRRNAFCGAQYKGGVAQLGERVNGIHEVRGSIPLASTRWTDGRACGWNGLHCERAGIAQLVEHNLAKVGVAGSSPVSRSGNCGLAIADCGLLAGRTAPPINPQSEIRNPR